MPTVIVDPDGGAGYDYLSLNAALAGEQCDMSGVGELEFKCRCTSGGADTTQAIAANYTNMSSSDYIKIWADPAESYRHAGKWDDTKYRLTVSGIQSSFITSAVDYIRVDGIQIAKMTITTSNYYNMIALMYATADNECWYSNLVLRGAGTSDTSREVGIQSNNDDLNIRMWNVVIFNLGTSAGYSAGILLAGNEIYVQNVVSVGAYQGILVAAGAVLKNCYIATVGGDCYDGNGTMTKCASSDATGSSGLTGIAANTTQFVSVTGGSEDFHLPGTGSALYHAGVDTSGDSAPMNFTTDIDGDDYYDTGGVRSIGIDEYVAGAAQVVGPFPVHFNS